MVQIVRRFPFPILTILYTNNLQMNDTTSCNHSSIDLCCLTCRVMFMSCRLIFFTCRLMFMSRRIVFVTSRIVFVTCRIVFVTHRVQKSSYVRLSKSLIFISSGQSPTGILFPQSIHLCYIGVLWSIRVGNYLRSSF